MISLSETRQFTGFQALGILLSAVLSVTSFAALPIEGADSRKTVQAPAKTGQTVAPVKGTPEEIERYKKEMAERVKADRRNAKRGDVLTPELTAFLVRRFREITEGEDGAKIISLIQESNPGDLRLQVNGNYPKDAELATMPPVVLQAFPELPQGIEYRFVGCRVMLMAHDSRVVIDYTEECFW